MYKEDLRSYLRNLCSREKKAWKKKACRDSNPDLCDTGSALWAKVMIMTINNYNDSDDDDDDDDDNDNKVHSYSAHIQNLLEPLHQTQENKLKRILKNWLLLLNLTKRKFWAVSP